MVVEASTAGVERRSEQTGGSAAERDSLEDLGEGSDA